MGERNGKSDIDVQSRGYEKLVDEIKAVGGKPRCLLNDCKGSRHYQKCQLKTYPLYPSKKPKLLSQIDSDILNLFSYGVLPLFGPLTNIHLRAMLSKPFQCGRTELCIS